MPKLQQKQLLIQKPIILDFFILFCLNAITLSHSSEHVFSFIGIGVPHTGQCLCGSTAILSHSPLFFYLEITLVPIFSPLIAFFKFSGLFPLQITVSNEDRLIICMAVISKNS